MAELQDESVDVNELDAVAAQEVTKQEDDLPDEFKGKSPSEIARIALHARREMGRQANELGDIRKLADELIRSQLHKPKEEEKPREVDFFENPQEAIQNAISASPDVIAAKKYALQAQQGQALQKLSQMHPDFGNVVQDGEFQTWIGSSKIRQQLFNQAQSYDVDAADELLSTFKTLKAAKQQNVSEVDKTARTNSVKAASVDSGGTGESSKKVYRRADLIQLRIRDPQAFASRSDEINRAYAEGRVR